MKTYNDIYKDVYEQLKENKEICIGFQIRADNVKWQGDNIVLSSNRIVSLEDYAEELETDISKLLSKVTEKIYNDLQDSPEILLTVNLKKNCLSEFIGLGMSLYKEMSKVELVIAAALISSFVSGFLGLDFYKVKKNFETAKYTADKQVEVSQTNLEASQTNLETAQTNLEVSRTDLKTAETNLKTEEVKARQLEIQERLAKISQQTYGIGQKHLNKLSHDLGTGNVASNGIVKIEDAKLAKEIRKHLCSVIKTGADIDEYLRKSISDNQKREEIRDFLILTINLMTEKKLELYGITVDEWNNYWEIQDALDNTPSEGNGSDKFSDDNEEEENRMSM